MAGPIRVDVEVKGLKELNDRILVGISQEITARTGEALYKLAEEMMTRAKEEVPVDLGTLRASGHVQPPVVQDGVVSVTLGFGGAAGTYAAAVHEGARPHWAPKQMILDWARRKGLDEKAGTAIWVSIARKGTRGYKFLEKAVLEKQREISRRMTDAVKAAATSVAIRRPR